MTVFVDKGNRFQELRAKAMGEGDAPAKKEDMRKKGMIYVGEVKKILIGQGHKIEGPNYIVMRIPERKPLPGEQTSKIPLRMVQVHRDYFGAFDLISYKQGLGFVFHQVSILEEKSRKIKAIVDLHMDGWVWGRFKEGGRVKYRVFSVDRQGNVDEWGIFTGKLLICPRV